MSTEGPIYRRVLLVRHGHYERTGNAGDDVWELSALGRRQAVRAGKRLARVRAAAGGRFEGLYTSPWPRARQTAEIVAHEMELESVRIKPYLHETIPLPPPGDATPAVPSHVRRAVVHQVDRARRRFLRPATRNEIVLVASHGNLIRYLVASVLGMPFESWIRLDIAHASITELRIYAGNLETIFSYGETAHLPPAMVTTS